MIQGKRKKRNTKEKDRENDDTRDRWCSRSDVCRHNWPKTVVGLVSKVNSPILLSSRRVMVDLNRASAWAGVFEVELKSKAKKEPELKNPACKTNLEVMYLLIQIKNEPIQLRFCPSWLVRGDEGFWAEGETGLKEATFPDSRAAVHK